MRLRILMACAAAGLLAACGGSDETDEAQAGAETVAEPAAEQVAEATPAPPSGPALMPATPPPAMPNLEPEAVERLADVIVTEMEAIAGALESAVDAESADAAAAIIRQANRNVTEAALAAGITPDNPAMGLVMQVRADEVNAARLRWDEAGAAIQADHPELIPVIAEAMNELG